MRGARPRRTEQDPQRRREDGEEENEEDGGPIAGEGEGVEDYFWDGGRGP